MIDYHIHIESGPYQEDWLTKFLRVGRERGITEFGITEHLHCFIESKPILEKLTEGSDYQEEARFMRQWWQKQAIRSVEEYLDFILKMKAKGYPVKLACEVDYLRDCEELIGQFIEARPWDYIIGSVHWIQGWGFDFPDRIQTWQNKDLLQIYDQYFALVADAVRSRLFDVIGHLDLIKIFGHYPRGFVNEKALAVINLLASSKMSIEINTAGLRRPVREIYPALNLIIESTRLGISFTLGSDAHTPEDVGRDFDRAFELMKSAGIDRVATYQGRKKELLPLKDFAKKLLTK
ncbi:MAG: histidinol-phosphatase HisJ family protein [candidate division WOR-3 bacterium]